MQSLVLFAMYLPALLFAYIANRTYRHYFELYVRRRGEKVRDDIYPQNLEDWDARYASRPLQWLRDTPRLLLSTGRIGAQHQEDADLEAIRVAGARWSAAAIVAAIAGIIGGIVVVSIR